MKDKCTEENKEISPKVATMLQKKCFMDDVNIDAKYDEDLNENIAKAEEIMRKGGFSFKKWTKSGDPGEKDVKS